MSAQYKNINNTKLDKSIVYKYKFWQRQSLFGTSTFSEDIELAAGQSSRENRCFSVRIHALNDGIVRGDCPVLCCALRHCSSGLRSSLVDECNASVCLFVVTPVPSPPSCLVLGVRVSDLLTEWVHWLWALQWVFIIHCEWIWSLKNITSSRNRFGITAFQFSSVGLHRRCHLQLLNGI